MSKKTRRDASTYNAIGLLFIFIAGSLEMKGTPAELVIGFSAACVALWAGSVGYYEAWYEKETIKRNSDNELLNLESVV